MEQAIINQTYYLQIFISDDSGKGVQGLSIGFKIWKSQGGSLIRTGSMIEDLTTPGVYVQGHTFTQTGQYRILYNTPEGFYDSLISLKVL